MESVEHNVQEHRFVIDSEGHQSVLRYRLFEDQGVASIDFTSTFVPPESRGKGLAEKLVRTGLAWANEQGYKLHASCWYVAKFIRS
jgi:uncharacterized protein